MLIVDLTFRNLLEACALLALEAVLGRPVQSWRELVPSRCTWMLLPLRVLWWSAPVLLVFAFVSAFNFVRWCVS